MCIEGVLVVLALGLLVSELVADIITVDSHNAIIAMTLLITAPWRIECLPLMRPIVPL